MDYLKLVLETIKDRVYVLRDDGEIIFVTQSMMKAFGYGASEVIGRKIYELADEEYRERVVETLKSLEDGDEVKMRLLVKRKDGKRVYAGVIAKKIGEYVVVLGREVSNTVSLETLMRAAIDLLRNLPREVDEVESILRKYFDDAKFSEEVQELTVKNGEVTVPVKFQDKVLGSLTLCLPDWFELGDDNLELFTNNGRECGEKHAHTGIKESY